MPLPLLLAAALAAEPGRTFPATNFDSVNLAAAADVQIGTGRAFEVKASGQADALQRLTARVEGRTLVLGWSEGSSVHLRHPLRVTITLPRLASVKLGGAGSIVVDRVAGDSFAADLGGAGRISVGDVQVQSARASSAGTGEIRLAGKATSLDSSVSGVGTIDTRALTAQRATLSMSGMGHVRARVDGPTTVSLSGMGGVEVDGHPTCTVRKSGMGSVRCGA